jgi:hypothetical protein
MILVPYQAALERTDQISFHSPVEQTKPIRTAPGDARIFFLLRQAIESLLGAQLVGWRWRSEVAVFAA